MTDEIIYIIKRELQKPNLPKYKRNPLITIEKHLLGLSSTSIALELQISNRSVQRYIQEYKNNGLSSFLRNQKPGNKKKLTDVQLASIHKIINEPPSEVGYLLPEWTALLLKKYIQKAFQVSLSEEACRQLILSMQKDRKKQTPFKQRKLFQDQWSTYMRDYETEIWVLSDIYLGIRERRKNKQGKVPYYPEDLLKDPSEITNVDLTQKAKEEWLLCLKGIKSDAFFYWHHTDRHEELPRYKEIVYTIAKYSRNHKNIIFLPDAAIHRRNFHKIHIKKAKKEIKVQYFPAQSADLNPLYKLKENLLETYQLKKKKTQERKVLSEQKVKKILSYLDEISFHEK
ncbi:helix-turn-helix domain-containing protein [Peribacillus acanthi]|uniref:helix-turn-helix domain-containing protein n=1 Tax=Peribacillus acanthi TaxID=2171554 RepID=UPI000D3E828D|nr:helix-turn-helix domain-containing protein [Peribacillus acanthi]